MSDKSCYKTSNNKYSDCPPRMSDGRHFTDFRPNCVVNTLLRTGCNAYNSFEYRNFLVRNGQQLIDLNRQLIFDKNKCGPCVQPYEQGTMLPEQTKVLCDRHGCLVKVNDPTGLGQGRQYNSFPDNSFPVNMGGKNLVNCCTTPNDNFNNFGMEKTQGF